MSGSGDPHFDAALDLWREGRAPNPRPARRIVDRDAGRSKVAGAACRVCGGRTGLERHHLVPRSQRGDDVDENIVPLCGPWMPSCHKLVTENDPAALATLRGRLWPEEEAYVARKMGWGWLERRYPSEETRS
jgi:5-methylcytosine-specific restriction endonuclease McrA